MCLPLLGMILIVGCRHSTTGPILALDRYVERHLEVRHASVLASSATSTLTRPGGAPLEIAKGAAEPESGGGLASRRAKPRTDRGPQYGRVRSSMLVRNQLARDSQTHGESTGAIGSAARPLPGFRATLKRDLKSLPEDLWADTKAVYTSPTNLALLGLAYASALTIQSTDVDNSIADSLKGDDVFSDDTNNAFGAAGNPLTHLGVAGLWYLVGQRTQNAKTYTVGKTLMRALIINDLSTMVGKLATYKTSPNGESLSFPSGHTSSTFTVASVMHQAYGPWVGFPLYGLGVFVAVERLDDDEHYLSDVLMGSVMGLIIGHTVAGDHKLEIFGGEIKPYSDPNIGATGLVWHKRF